MGCAGSKRIACAIEEPQETMNPVRLVPTAPPLEVEEEDPPPSYHSLGPEDSISSGDVVTWEGNNNAFVDDYYGLVPQPSIVSQRVS